MEYKEIKDIEPKVVVLTMLDDEPEISVRMPIYKADVTHDMWYLELRYALHRKTRQIIYSCQLSPDLLAMLTDAERAFAALPVALQGQVEPHGALGMIENVYFAAKKLYEFDQAGKFLPYFQKKM